MSDINCEHKFIHRDFTAYWRFLSRYTLEYVRVDTYFCEKCLETKEVRQFAQCPPSDTQILPDWAKTITNKVAGYEY